MLLFTLILSGGCSGLLYLLLYAAGSRRDWGEDNREQMDALRRRKKGKNHTKT